MFVIAAATSAPRYGFGQEYGAGRQIVVFDLHKARRRNDLDRWPSIPNEPGKLQTVHRARHLDIGEDNVNIGLDCEDCDGFVGVGRLDDVKAGVFDQLGGIHP